MLIKARHICYTYYPAIILLLSKNIKKTNHQCNIFKPKNVEEFVTLAKELFNMKANDAYTLFNYTFQKPYDHLDMDTWFSRYYRNFNLLDIKFKSAVKPSK